MKRIFNTTGLCVPEKHYMVNLGSRLNEVRALVEQGAYFTVNRARQYGKTTLLNALTWYLADDYLVVSMDFQAIGNGSFDSEAAFSRAFALLFLRELKYAEDSLPKQLEEWTMQLETLIRGQKQPFMLIDLFGCLLTFCQISPKPVVLMVDEVDSATNNQVFLDFLAQLRNYYLDREKKGIETFRSVILAGVYDVRNLRRKIRDDEVHKLNSPWNVAADFNVDMSFSKNDIIGMLKEYEADYHTGMDVEDMAGLLHEYTSGYPFLVSRLCKLIDEVVSSTGVFENRKAAWTRNGFFEAERILLAEKNTLFDSLTGKLQEYAELRDTINEILFTGTDIEYNADNPLLDMAAMFGFIVNRNSSVAIANRIFETRLYNYYLSDAAIRKNDIYRNARRDKGQFIAGGHLNMRRILEKFAEHFHDIYGECTEKFIEDDGRKLFLLYLRPIINGTGNYYIEAQTRDLTRTDVIVDYCGEQFVVELKIWHGDAYNRRGERQLAAYLDAYHARKGYMLSFCFNKNKKTGIQEVAVGDKLLIEAVV